MTQTLHQRRGETMEQYIARINGLTKEQKEELVERTFTLERYAGGARKETDFRKKIYHK